MNNIDHEAIFGGIVRHRRKLRLLGTLTAIFAVAISFAMAYIPFAGFPEQWSFDVIRYEIQNGTFWLFPGSAFYQHTMLLGTHNVLEVIASFLLEFTLVWIVLHLVYRSVVYFVVGLRKTHRASQLEEALRLYSQSQYAILFNDQTEARVNILGSTLYIEVKVDSTLPNFFVDSHAYSIERHIGRKLLLPRHKRVVLDRASDQVLDIYADLELSKAAKFFTSDVAQHFVKRMSQSDVFVSNGRMYVMTDIHSLHSASDTQLLLESIEMCRSIVVKRARKLFADSVPSFSHYNIPLQAALQTVPHLFTVRRSLGAGAAIYIVAMLLLALVFLGDKASVGALLGPVWIAIMYTLVARWLKVRDTMVARKLW